MKKSVIIILSTVMGLSFASLLIMQMRYIEEITSLRHEYFKLKFKGFGIKGNELRYAFILLSLALIFIVPTYSILAIIVLYIAISTLRWLFTKTEKAE